jgi:hypothetical protein
MTDSVQLATPKPDYVAYKPDLEQLLPDEDKLIDEIVQALRRNNEWAFKRYQHAVRDAHAKSHGFLKGHLTVYPDLPIHLRQGLFALPETYPVIARLSSTHPAIRSDQVRGIRAIAIKVLGVKNLGRRALPDDNGTNQDFVLVNHAEFPYADARDYLHKGMPAALVLARAPESAIMVLTEVLGRVVPVLSRVGVPVPAALGLFATPNTHILGQTFHSSAPLRYGDFVAKVRVAPLSASVKGLERQPVPCNAGFDAHGEMVAEYFRCNSSEYEVQVQLCTDLKTMPIENASVAWSDVASPPKGVAKITFPIQQTDTPERRVFADDVLAFNSWNGLDAHRPLGSINRLKKQTYDASSKFRHHMNNVPLKEPAEVTDLPN